MKPLGEEPLRAKSKYARIIPQGRVALRGAPRPGRRSPAKEYTGRLLSGVMSVRNGRRSSRLRPSRQNNDRSLQGILQVHRARRVRAAYGLCPGGGAFEDAARSEHTRADTHG